MRIYNMLKLTLIIMCLLFCFLNLWGCGITASQEVAKSAVENAKLAVKSAEDLNAAAYSPKNMKAAKQFLDEADQALSNNRRQRAYTLAGKSEKAANAAEVEARQNLGIVNNRTSRSITELPGTIQPLIQTQQSARVPSNILFPSTTELPETQVLKKSVLEPLNISSQDDHQISDMQNRIQAAVQALEAAQKAVESARLLVFKIQVEIEMSRTDANIKQIQNSNASEEVVRLIRLWYNQAQQAESVGNYENSILFLQRIQTYVQILTTPIQ